MGRLVLLATAGHSTLVKYKHPNLGRLTQPREFMAGIADTANEGWVWAADNDAFGGWDPDRAKAYCRMLEKIRGLEGCKFVTAPDVVGDHKATAELFEHWCGVLNNYGLPVALVAQDGLEDVPWSQIDALFIGGTDDFKMSQEAEGLCQDALKHGKWLHMGRVNGFRRLKYAASIGCHSVDGSSWVRWRDTWLPKALDWLEQGTQLSLDPA